MYKKFSENHAPVIRELEIEPENVGPAADAQGFGCLYFTIGEEGVTWYLLDLDEDPSPPEGAHYVGMCGDLA